MSKAPRSGPPNFDGDLQPAAAGRGLARRLTALRACWTIPSGC